MVSSFTSGTIYVNLNIPNKLWVCLDYNGVGRLEEFERQNTCRWNATGNKFFLGFFQYQDNSFKMYITNPEYYEIVGKLYQNYNLGSDDKGSFLQKKTNTDKFTKIR